MKHKSLLIACLMASVCFSSALADGPEVWFCPRDITTRTGQTVTTVKPYTDLFNPDAPWKETAGRVTVFKLYTRRVENTSDADLKAQFADLKRRGIILALEYGCLIPRDQADKKQEGFNPNPLLAAVRRIEENGGDLKYVAMDEPFCLSLTISKRPPVMSVQEIADNATKNIKETLAVYPNIKIGDIEPFGIADAKAALDAYQEGWKAFAKDGVPIAFFNADIEWKKAGVLNELRAARDAAKKAKIPFGIIYDGNADDRSDAAWIDNARKHMADAEFVTGTPDSVVFQSWHMYPKKYLPEQEADSFTNLVNSYFRTRTVLPCTIVGSKLTGRLVTAKGEPVANAKIQVTAQPVARQGVMTTLTVTGVVPPGCTTVCFGLRANKGGWPGTDSVRIQEMKVQTKDGWSTGRTFNSPEDLKEWGGAGIGQGGRISLDGGDLCVNPGNPMLEYNSAHTPANISGKPFTFTVQAQVPPAAVDAGAFGVFFLAQKPELLRAMIPFQPASIPEGTAVTDADGTWTLQLSGQKEAVKINASYAGDDNYWPARGSVTD